MPPRGKIREVGPHRRRAAVMPGICRSDAFVRLPERIVVEGLLYRAGGIRNRPDVPQIVRHIEVIAAVGNYFCGHILTYDLHLSKI